MPEYSLRPATDADHDFLYRLHVAAMREYVAQMWGWDEARQIAYFDAHFDPASACIIVSEGADVGVVAVEWRAGEAFIANIALLPECQGRGIGAAVVRGIIAEAGARGLPVALHVLKVNPAPAAVRAPRLRRHWRSRGARHDAAPRAVADVRPPA